MCACFTITLMRALECGSWWMDVYVRWVSLNYKMKFGNSDGVWLSRNPSIMKPHSFQWGQKCITANGRTRDGQKVRKEWVWVGDDFMDVSSELARGILSSLLSLEWSVTEQESFESKPPFISMGPKNDRKTTKTREQERQMAPLPAWLWSEADKVVVELCAEPLMRELGKRTTLCPSLASLQAKKCKKGTERN